MKSKITIVATIIVLSHSPLFCGYLYSGEEMLKGAVKLVGYIILGIIIMPQEVSFNVGPDTPNWNLG